MIEICTTGGYGHTRTSFFDSLATLGVDALVDLRQRRGMRGRQYAFLNSKSLQEELQMRGVAYLHLKALAPPASMRAVQMATDLATGVSKRERAHLSADFASAYKAEVLGSVDVGEVLRSIAQFQRPCFFCVEQHPDACHRSLVAEWAATQTSCGIRHL